MSRLDKDMIAQPELWKLALLLGESHLDVGLFPPTPREEMIAARFNFPSSAPDALHAIEDIIFDNPLLFSDFKRVDCIINNCPQILVPSALDLPAAAIVYDRSTDSRHDTDHHLPEPSLFDSGDSQTAVACVEPEEIDAFIRRTFYNVRFDSAIASLTRYFLSLPDLPPTPSAFILLRDRRLTLIIIDQGRLLLANTFAYRADADAAYYVIAALSALGLDPTTVTAYISPASDAVSTTLKTHLPALAPIPLPILRHCASKTTLQAPFELIIRPLCE